MKNLSRKKKQGIWVEIGFEEIYNKLFRIFKMRKKGQSTFLCSKLIE